MRSFPFPSPSLYSRVRDRLYTQGQDDILKLPFVILKEQ